MTSPSQQGRGAVIAEVSGQPGAPHHSGNDGERSLYRYRRLWSGMVIATSLVSLGPLLTMVAVNYYQYHKAFEEEVQHPIHLLTSSARQSLHFFLDARLSALDFLVHERSYTELSDQRHLTRIFSNLKRTHADLVDLGVIDEEGRQVAYVGPYTRLRDKDYSEQAWFKEVLLRGRGVSDVFLGYRQFPHFAIAMRNLRDDGKVFIVRATLNAEVLVSRLGATARLRALDSFIINQQGILQTASRRYGPALTKAAIAVPPPTSTPRIIEQRSANGEVDIVGYCNIDQSPFVFMVVEHRDALLTSWFTLRNKLVLFMAISILVIVLVILVGARYTVNRLREADDKRLAMLHNVEYTAKMASIGRLAAGVAHEVNNPLAIINEKAGLLQDIIAATDQMPRKDKLEQTVAAIVSSVDRCARITRRLLRFAKHIDVTHEPINLEALLREVLSFLEKECAFRRIDVSIDVQPEVPVIESDRGRLQQVFLNIINNAIGAVADGGRIHLLVTREGDHQVSVTIRDNGVGIPADHLSRIFEPFFTTKDKHGTGLGLSITYGLVEKLGGRITVDSQVGEWTKFTVILPVQATYVAKEGQHDPEDPVG